MSSETGIEYMVPGTLRTWWSVNESLIWKHSGGQVVQSQKISKPIQTTTA